MRVSLALKDRGCMQINRSNKNIKKKGGINPLA